MDIIKIILLVIACMGTYMHVKRKFEIKEEFIPIILVSVIGIIEFLAGILNYMRETSIIIILIGVGFAIYEIYLQIRNNEKISINRNFILFTVMIGWSAYMLNGVILTHWDNFTHWAVIIRELVETNELPNFESKFISFTSYPPGSACFVYFICKLIGFSESKMLFAQSIMVLSSAYTLFAFTQKNKRSSYIIPIITVLFMLVGNIFIDHLLVDTLIPVMGIAALGIMVYYKNDNRKGLLYSIPILSLLILVKNSGILFVLFDLLVWCVLYIKNNGVKSIVKDKYIAIILLPIILQFIWTGHLGIAFANAEKSKHSMTIENYTATFDKKDTSHIISIKDDMIDRMTDFTNYENIILILLLILYIIMIYVSWKNKKLRNWICCSLILVVGIYVAYQMSLFFMYVFSMTIEEAVILASYQRYFRTLVLFEYGITAITIINFLDNINLDKKIIRRSIKSGIIIMLIIPILFYPKVLKKCFIKTNKTSLYENSIRYELVEYKKQYDIREYKSYIIYIGDDESINSSYLTTICNYDFRSKNIRVIRSFSELGNANEIFAYDYFIILRKTTETNEFLDKMQENVEKNVIKIK